MSRALLALLALTPLLAQENLLPNPSFEVDADGDGMPDAWDQEIREGNQGVFAQDQDVHLDGAASLRIEHPDDNALWVRSSVNNVPATPRSVYRFDAAVRATGPWTVMVYEFRPTSQDQPYLSYSIASGGDTKGAWQRVGQIITTSDIAQSFKVSCVTHGQTVAWFDALSLVKVGAIPDADALAVKQAPKVDGQLDDAAWLDAPRAGPFFVLGGAGERPAAATYVQTVWTTDRLFVAYRCAEPAMDKLVAKVTEADGPVYTDDAVETFLDPGMTGSGYAHLAVNAAGVTFDQRQLPSRYNVDWYSTQATSLTDWDPAWQAAASKGDGEWTVEFSIPFDALGGTPQPGDTWGANFCRERYAEPELSTWAPLEGDRFAQPQSFGRLTFRGPVARPPEIVTRGPGDWPARPPLVPQPQQAEEIGGWVDLPRPLPIQPSDDVAAKYLEACLKLFPAAVALPVGQAAGKHVSLRHVEKLNGGPADAAGQERFQSEGYQMRQAGDGIDIAAASALGFRNGLMTLLQVSDFDAPDHVAVQVRAIEDWPDTGWRAWHVGSPSQTELPDAYGWVETLAKLKYNYVLFEVNDNFRYESHPEIGRDTAPTKQELRDLVAHCRALGLEVIPQVQVYGHFNWVLNKPGWQDLAEQPADEASARWGLWNANIRDPRYYPLVFDLYQEVIDVFQPQVFHIGHDEITFRPIGVNPATKDSTPAELIAEEITKLHDWLKERGLETMMWGDQLLKEQHGGPPHNTWTAVDDLPKDIIINDWHYAPWTEFPSLAFLKDHGYRVLASGWWDPLNMMNFSDGAVQQQVLGFSGTSWWGLGNFRNSAEHQTAFVLAAENSWSNGQPQTRDLAYWPWQAWRVLAGWGGVPAETHYAPIDLSRQANQSLSDNRRHTGWLGTGNDDDFSMLPRGLNWWAGVPFQILDGGDEAIMLAAEGDPERSWPVTVKAIGVGTKAHALHFLHTTSAPDRRYGNIYDRGKNYPSEVGRYVIHYADGTTAEARMIYRQTITDWNAALPPGSRRAGLGRDHGRWREGDPGELAVGQSRAGQGDPEHRHPEHRVRPAAGGAGDHRGGGLAVRSMLRTRLKAVRRRPWLRWRRPSTTTG